MWSNSLHALAESSDLVSIGGHEVGRKLRTEAAENDAAHARSRI